MDNPDLTYCGKEDELRDWHECAHHVFPTSASPDKLEDTVKHNYNDWSYQVSVLVANMGNLQHVSVVGGRKVSSTGLLPLVASFCRRNWAHIRLFIEAEGLLKGDIQKGLLAHNLIGRNSTRWPDLAVYITGSVEAGSSIYVIAEGGSDEMRWAIFKLHFGRLLAHSSSNICYDTKEGRTMGCYA